MSFKIGQIIETDSDRYYVLDQQDYEGEKYIYTAELDEEDDISGDFYVFKINDEAKSMNKVTDSSVLKRVLPLFINSLKKYNSKVGE